MGLAILSGRAAAATPAAVDTLALPRPVDDSTRLEALTAQRRGVRFLLARQLPDGSWGENPAVTSLATLALLNCGENEEPAIPAAAERGVTFIVEHLPQPAADSLPVPSAATGYPVLATAVGVLAILRLDRPADHPTVGRLRQYLLNAQCLNVAPTDPRYGGFCAVPGGAPDLATTDYVLEALYLSDTLDRTPDRTAVAEKAYQAYRAAAGFLSRCQCLSATPESPEIGWFAPMPPETADSRALPPRSRGHLTCIGLKSLLYSRVSPADRRVQLAGAWLEQRFSLSANPGSPGNAGYFTYLHALSRTLNVWERATVAGAPPFRPAWRRALVEELLSRQQANGGWLNESADWWENRAELTTAYALLAMELALD